MTGDGPLFDGWPPSQPIDTSEAAATSVRHVQGKLQWRVLRFVARFPGGVTADEIEVTLGMRGNTLHPRLWELEKGGYIVKSDYSRPTRSGRFARVYLVTRLGTRRLREQ